MPWSPPHVLYLEHDFKMPVNGSAERFLCFLWFSAGHVCALMRLTNTRSGSGAGASLINLLLVQALR